MTLYVIRVANFSNETVAPNRNLKEIFIKIKKYIVVLIEPFLYLVAHSAVLTLSFF